jgi:hypothetical protein
MKLSELKKVIRSTIKTEVRNAIREELTDIMLGKEMQSEPAKLSSVVKSNKPQPKTQKRFSTNPQLNEILNQTVGFTGANNEVMEEDSKTISMDSSVAQSGNLKGRFAQLMGLEDSGLQSLDNNLAQTAAAKGINPETLPDGVKNMFTKDYSKVLKKIDEKQGKV